MMILVQRHRARDVHAIQNDVQRTVHALVERTFPCMSRPAMPIVNIPARSW